MPEKASTRAPSAVTADMTDLEQSRHLSARSGPLRLLRRQGEIWPGLCTLTHSSKPSKAFRSFCRDSPSMISLTSIAAVSLSRLPPRRARSKRVPPRMILRRASSLRAVSLGQAPADGGPVALGQRQSGGRVAPPKPCQTILGLDRPAASILPPI